jgi:hypothetical protein|tara:strand:- start:69 stop:377 length:309 start_codon:yes stop_codon:yes gene_type:complete
MLIGSSSKRPNIESVRRIKRVLGEAIELPEDALITVSQLACLEEDCAPLETVIGLLRSGTHQLQYKVHKPTDAIDADDLLQVCQAWGFSVTTSTLESLLKEI